MNKLRFFCGVVVLAFFGLLFFCYLQRLEILSARSAQVDFESAKRKFADQKLAASQVKPGAADPVTSRVLPNVSEDNPQQPDRGQSARASPAYQQLRQLQVRATVTAEFSPFAQRLAKDFNFSAEKIKDFQNLMVEKYLAVQDAAEFSRTPSANVSPADMRFHQAAIQQAVTESEKELKMSLGPDAYISYAQYVDSLPQRVSLNQLQDALIFAQAPLNDQQAQQLLEVLHRESTGGGQISDAAVSKASTFLSQPQLDSLKELQKQQLAKNQMRNMLHDISK